MKFLKLILILTGIILLLGGCSMLTVDQMYCLPKRPEESTNLQSLIDSQMAGLDYSAPLSGDHQQAVQQADLDGDGQNEYLLFAKETNDRPLHIFIFAFDGVEYYLLDTIDCVGYAFDRVEYVQMSDSGGVELVVGRQVSDQVLRSLSVYALINGEVEQVMSTNYSKFLCGDLDEDHLTELMVLSPGPSNTENGVAELYSMKGSTVERSVEVSMSGPSDSIKRIMTGKLNDGGSAVFVTTEVEGNAIITDVFSVVDGTLTNVSLPAESGTSIQTLRNYYVYADDVDNDGILELPNLCAIYSNVETSEQQYVIRWYALNSDGSEVDKRYTYHNYAGGWYLQLDGDIAYRLNVNQNGNSFEFQVWDYEYLEYHSLMTVYVLTGQRREEQAVASNRFVIYRSDTTVYAARLDIAATACGITKESLIEGFHLIVEDWNTGLT